MRLLSLTILLLVAAVAGPVLAMPIDVHIRDVDLSEFPRVNVVFGLDSPHKLDFRRLPARSMYVVEEEVQITDVAVIPHEPQLSLALVLDDSGSQDHTLANLKRSVTRLVESLKPCDQAAVVSFARGTRVITELTADKHTLVDAVGRLKAYGASALFDGLTVGIAEVHRAPGKRAVLVVTDGVDQVFPGGHPLSEDSLSDVVHMARVNGVEVYAVGIGDRVNHRLLATLAHLTGGLYLRAASESNVGDLLERIALSFGGTFKLAYTSPRAVEDSKLREARVTVNYQGHHGSEVFGYRLDERTAVEDVNVRRTNVYTPGTGDLQVFTLGLREQPLPLSFYLFDRYNRPVRQGVTSADGYGKLDDRDPELVKLLPGTYRLELEVPGTAFRSVHPNVVIVAGKTLRLEYHFSKLVFRRNEQVWYDTPHPYGDTSELISLKIVNLADGRTIHSGRLVDFMEKRETAVWLEQGRYRVELGNVWHQAPPADVEKVVLRNRLEAEIASPGGTVMLFDVVDSDLVYDKDVLATAQRPSQKPFHRVSTSLDLERPASRADARSTYALAARDEESAPYYPDDGDVRSYSYRKEDLKKPAPPIVEPEKPKQEPQPAPVEPKAEERPATTPKKGQPSTDLTSRDPLGRLKQLAGTLGADTRTRGKLFALVQSLERPGREQASPPGALTPRTATPAPSRFVPDGTLGSQVVGQDQGSRVRDGSFAKEATRGTRRTRRAPSRDEEPDEAALLVGAPATGLAVSGPALAPSGEGSQFRPRAAGPDQAGATGDVSNVREPVKNEEPATIAAAEPRDSVLSAALESDL
ncbi:MAG: VWA domain-containing protein, partial [Candidatus Riflebacteria bacterium]|nr:VWA domain-containing protein [Candidatus Riflebacteria bacterium]